MMVSLFLISKNVQATLNIEAGHSTISSKCLKSTISLKCLSLRSNGNTESKQFTAEVNKLGFARGVLELEGLLVV